MQRHTILLLLHNGVALYRPNRDRTDVSTDSYSGESAFKGENGLQIGSVLPDLPV